MKNVENPSKMSKIFKKIPIKMSGKRENTDKQVEKT